MVPTLDRTLLETASQHPVNWRGRSGRFYALEPRPLDNFTFTGDELFLVALGPHVLWAGGALDLVEDPMSRARFRLAMDCADRAFRVEASPDAVERLTVVWDLEGAEPVLGLNAA